MVDSNADGGLDIQELYSMSQRSRESKGDNASTGAGSE
jgi:hypothetical protein